MPLDYGRRLDHHQGIEDLRPNPIKPHPEEAICGEQPKPTWALTPQDGHRNDSRSRGAQLRRRKVDGSDIGKNRDHAGNGMVMARKSLAFFSSSEF
jgi:hypothetical protein